MLSRPKFFLILLMTLMMLSFSGLTVVSTFAAYPAGVISHWKLDEGPPAAPNSTYQDSFGVNNGIGNENPAAATDGGIVAGAQYFSGASTGIDVPAHASFNWSVNDSFSIEYWINVDPGISAGNHVALGRFEDKPDGFGVFWFIAIDGTTGFANCIFEDTANDSASLTGTTNLRDATWHHILMVRDDNLGSAGGTNLLYVDGILEDSVEVDYTGAFFSDSASLNIGWFDFGGGFRFQGLIDEVALYDRALTETEIQQHFDEGMQGHGIETLVPGPEADAGPDQIVFDEITLDGSLSTHPTGASMTYQWTLVHREDPAFNQTADGVDPTVQGLAKGFYDVTLTVSDDQGGTDTDQMLFSATGPKGDFDSDGDVDGFDLSVFSEHYGL